MCVIINQNYINNKIYFNLDIAVINIYFKLIVKVCIYVNNTVNHSFSYIFILEYLKVFVIN